MKEKVRIQYIDMAKGFAILCVVYGHVMCYDLYGFENANSSVLFRFIYSFHMPLFIFLSGLVSKIDLPMRDMFKDLYKKYRSLIVPFFVVGSIYSLFYGHNLHFILYNGKWGYWYLCTVFALYFLTYPISKIGKGKIKILLQLLFGVVVWRLLVLLPNVLSNSVCDILSIYQISTYFPYFFIARLVTQYKLQDILWGNHYIFWVLLMIWMFLRQNDFLYSNYIIGLSLTLIVLYLCRLLEKRTECKLKNYIKKIFMKLGRNSLYIYIYHYFFLNLFHTVFLEDMLPKYSNFGYDLVLGFIPALSVIFLSLVLHFIINNNHKLMNYVFYKNVGG